MLHTKLLILIVSSLAGPICRSALAMENDISVTSSAKDNFTNHKYLKCKCLLSGLTHMRLSKLALENPKISLEIIVGIVIWCDGREMISLLYNLDDVKIGSLWPLHLYTGMLRSYFDLGLSKEGGSGRPHNVEKKISGIHSYVTELLFSDWDANDCSTFNLKDRYHKWLTRNPDPDLEEIKELVRKNHNKLHSFLNVKKDMMTANEYQTNLMLKESLKMNNLFLKDFGLNLKTRNKLMNNYNVKLDWTDTDGILSKSWENAMKVTWTDNNLKNIKIYYMRHLNFLKIIFFRIIWKDLLYIKEIKRISSMYLHYVRQCYVLLIKFGKMLCIKNDPHIQNLLKSIDKLANRKKSVDGVIDDLQVILESSALSLNCNATKPITFDKITVRCHLRTILKSKGILAELSTQKTAMVFIRYLRLSFKGVDFDVIWSLIKYIDEINEVSD